MTIRKRGKSYFIEKMYKGKRYSMTVSFKPTKTEAERLIFDLIDSKQVTVKGTFLDHAEKYMSSKDNILSPSTKRGYKTIINQLPYSFKNAAISALSPSDVQILVNELSARLSPKSVRNISGFVSAVMRSVNPNWDNTVMLPQKKVESFYVPEKDDVKKILNYEKGTGYEVPFWLAVYGLRCSEICALETSDLKDNMITVNKALVRGDDNKYYLKSTKTTQSTREVFISDYVADLIRALPPGRVCQYRPNSLNVHLKKVQNRLGIEKFNIHLLRHFFASTAREVMPDVYVEKMGGWKKGSKVMRQVYDYAQKKELEKAQANYAEKVSEFLT